ncbi:SgcJ/EcaC family oxidoreductase [Novosphingobium sp. 9U]|uniref:SgcJ/EcaC family oxidoreductase n=1 Tax=Novosphingobium sp. 9U TaxID=2653158 RepID=UPI0012F2E74C|nr:SgcJ/EcaC family oxidoreductase [Novosphingobium sp. 9U]VWX53988.1 hypothetical protein NOVOSPHI9U_560005 [Novosphingobium sp. 9U]
MIDAAAALIAKPLVDQFAASWNTHKLIGFDAIFWPDSTFIHRGGDLINGGVEIRNYHSKLHTDPFFATSRLVLTIERARQLAPNVVLVTVRSPAWLGPKQSVEVGSRPTFVITRKNSSWRIAFCQNTELERARQATDDLGLGTQVQR